MRVREHARAAGGREREGKVGGGASFLTPTPSPTTNPYSHLLSHHTHIDTHTRLHPHQHPHPRPHPHPHSYSHPHPHPHTSFQREATTPRSGGPSLNCMALRASATVLVTASTLKMCIFIHTYMLYSYIHICYIHIYMKMCFTYTQSSHIHTYIYVIFIYTYIILTIRQYASRECYGMATVGRIDKITGLFCKRAL